MRARMEGARRRVLVAMVALGACVYGLMVAFGGDGGLGRQGRAVELVGRGGGARGAVPVRELKQALKEVKRTLAGLQGFEGDDAVSGVLPPGSGDEPLDEALVTEDELVCYFKSDIFLNLVNSCCKTLYFGPGTDALLPIDLPDSPPVAPYRNGLPYGVRFRYIIGNRNDFVLNGGSEEGIAWINHYFGFQIRTVPASSKLYVRKVHPYVNGDPNPPPHAEYQAIHRMPDEVPLYDQMVTVDPASLPDGALVLYDNTPPGYEHVMQQDENFQREVPAFTLRYCEARTELLNGGMPVKVTPSDCEPLSHRGIKCQCGNVVFMGWVWGDAASSDLWEHSLIFVDDEAKGSCKAAPPEGPANPMPLPPRVASHKVTSCDDYHVEFDPAAQHWYYEVAAAGGGTTRMVRHWCPSEWVPQERFYKYQRYVPRTNNNLPAPPINDFDFLDSYARGYYAKSRRAAARRMTDRPFDDWNLGNSDSDMNKHIVRPARHFDDWTLGNTLSNMGGGRGRGGGGFDDDALGNSGAQMPSGRRVSY